MNDTTTLYKSQEIERKIENQNGRKNSEENIKLVAVSFRLDFVCI